MATSAPVLVSVDEYLNTSYRPDCDYIDGEVLERNMGEIPHSRLQTFFIRFFGMHEDDWQIEVLSEQRVQIAARRFRIPDIMLTSLPNLDERIVRTPPLLCVEILSSNDRLSKVLERIRDYSRMGVPVTWVIDPWRGVAYSASDDKHLILVEDRLTVPGTEIAIGVQEIWAEFERIEKRAAGPAKR